VIASWNKKISVLVLLMGAVLLFSFDISADSMNSEIVVPKDELAQESVYPIFDNLESVKSRNIQDSQTFDVGVFGGLAITEPIASTTKYGISLNYHINEVHSLGLLWATNSSGLSKDAEGLRSDFGLDFTRAPYPVYSIMGDYNYKLYYGKLSVTKNGVINTSLYASTSAGVIKYIHKTYPGVAIGVGERFYFSKNFAFKVDLRLFINSAPIPFKSGALRAGIDPIPTYDSFSERISYTTNLEFGVNYLF